MIFDIQTNNNKIIECYTISEMAILSEEFDHRLRDVRTYTYTKMLAREVYGLFSLMRAEIKTGKRAPVRVKTYNYPSKSVMATTGLKADPEAIFVNLNNINLFTREDYIVNGAHEWTHSPFGFSHGSNYTQETWRGRMMCKLYGDKDDKGLSVPYTFSRIAIEVAKSKGWV